jgi:hypothetical protein
MQINILNTRKYLPYIVIAVLFILLLTRTASLEIKNDKLLIEAEKHDLRAKYLVSQYDTLKKQDSVLKLKYDSIESTRTIIKIRYNEKIKVINKYSVSDMQHYFDERTKEGSNTGQYSGQ